MKIGRQGGGAVGFQRKHRQPGLCAMAAFLLLFLGSEAHAQPKAVELPVILSLSGDAAFLGQGERNALRIEQGVVNKDGGINGAPLQFQFYDDQSDPQTAVQLATQVKAGPSPIILGPSLTSTCNAVAPLMQAGPVLYCLSPGIHPPAGSYVFTGFVSTTDLAHALIRYFKGRGFTRIALITSTDATGQDGRRNFESTVKLPENAGISLVADVQFDPTDVSVAGQVQKMRAANPQAVIVWATGTPMGTVLRGLLQGGLNVPVATTDANMTYAQMKAYADILPSEMLLMSSEWPPHGANVTLDPRVAAAQEKMFAAYKAAGSRPDITAALAWDVGALAVDALRQAGPAADPSAIRKFISGTKGWAGINGIYDFTRIPQRGLDVDDAVVTRWNAETHQWTIVSSPGGSQS